MAANTRTPYGRFTGPTEIQRFMPSAHRVEDMTFGERV